MKTMRLRHSWLMTAAMLGLMFPTGCSLIGALYRPNPEMAPKQPVAPEAKAVQTSANQTDGSLWVDNPTSWFSDNKAFRPGDIVLVQVSQTNTGSKDSTTDTSRDSKASTTIKHFFGAEDKINGLTGYTKAAGAAKAKVKNSSADWAPVPLVDAESSNSFKGAGATKRSDALTATVSAVVTQLLPNGNLVIYGHQNVTVNNEASVLTVQGIVRPADINVDNTVDSERIANADIQFTGSGVVSDKQHPGWAIRVMDWVMPF